jgi:hypothetical protein
LALGFTSILAAGFLKKLDIEPCLEAIVAMMAMTSKFINESRPVDPSLISNI